MSVLWVRQIGAVSVDNLKGSVISTKAMSWCFVYELYCGWTKNCLTSWSPDAPIRATFDVFASTYLQCAAEIKNISLIKEAPQWNMAWDRFLQPICDMCGHSKSDLTGFPFVSSWILSIGYFCLNSSHSATRNWSYLPYILASHLILLSTLTLSLGSKVGQQTIGILPLNEQMFNSLIRNFV